MRIKRVKMYVKINQIATPGPEIINKFWLAFVATGVLKEEEPV